MRAGCSKYRLLHSGVLPKRFLYVNSAVFSTKDLKLLLSVRQAINATRAAGRILAVVALSPHLLWVTRPAAATRIYYIGFSRF